MKKIKLPNFRKTIQFEYTIRAVYEKGFYYNNEVLAMIRENIISKSKPKANFALDLTSREKEILQLICEQYNAPEIAEKLFISPRTADGHRNNLLSKLACKNVGGLVVLALQHQIVDIPLRY